MVNGRLQHVRSWLWPGHCLLCRAQIDAGEELCHGCRAELPWIEAACPRCAAALPPDSASAPCGSCQRKPPVFDRTYAALHYAPPLDQLILGLKYHRRLDLARTLGRLLAQRLPSFAGRPDVLIPVPLHTSRLRQRGYNQSLELARVIAKQLGLPVAGNAARRLRETPAQTGLPLEKRAGNVRNAFAVDADLAGQHIAIVDDVMTSGHTVNAFARVLRRAGAAEISVWVVARA